MRRRQKLPKIWLMTDERLGDHLLDAVVRLPAGSGIVFRHYSLDPGARRRLFDQVRRVARRRRHLLLLAGPPALAAAWSADGSHGRGRDPVGGLRSAPVHGERELRRAIRDGAGLLFLSPLFPTRSHPGAAALGPRRFARFARLARRSSVPVIALGGMTAEKARLLRAIGAYGWAAIDAWNPDQKRKAVPI